MQRLHILLFASRERTTEEGLLDDRLGNLLADAGFPVIRLPHLYDLAPQSGVARRLRDLRGNLIILARLYPRAAFWTLDGHGVQGAMGVTRSCPAEEIASPVAGSLLELPARTIWCFDLREVKRLEPMVAEIQQLGGGGAIQRSTPEHWEEPVAPRWYPVIDYDRCLGCMECLNFCLFGVYDLDEEQKIRALQPDACRDGCPACSRICPGGAILFPAHREPSIAGGGSGQNRPPRKAALPISEAAVDEVERARAEQAQALSKMQQSAAKRAENPAADELDRLVDGLDG